MFSQNHLERKTEKCALHRKAASFRKTRETATGDHMHAN